MATYLFENHEAELIDPVIEDWEVSFTKSDVQQSFINVSIDLSTNDSKVRNVVIYNITVEQYVLNIPNLEALIRQHMDENHLVS